jgi:hypothetical protein
MEPFTAGALLTLITQGVKAGAGHLAQRRQENFATKRAGLQDVLQGLDPQTQGQQPERRGQEGWESHIASVMADPLVQKWMENKLTGLGEDQSTKRTNLPDARQVVAQQARPLMRDNSQAARRSSASRAVARRGPEGGPMVDETAPRKYPAANRPVAARQATGSGGWQPSDRWHGATTSGMTWPDGRPVTLQEARDMSIPMAIRQTWRQNVPMPSGARTPRSATSRGEGGLLDPLFSRLRG